MPKKRGSPIPRTIAGLAKISPSDVERAQAVYGTDVPQREKVIRDYRDSMAALAAGLQSGRLTLADWQMQMEEQIKTLCLLMMFLAFGVWDDREAWDFVALLIAAQYAYLLNWAQELSSGLLPSTARAIMYADAGRGMYWSLTGQRMKARGATLEQRILTPGAEHCEGGARPGCVELAALGKKPIGSLLPIGEAQCLTHCLCEMRYFSADGKEME